tara:strand:+ start:48 stop:257 length:210 start_codon:yes stop_codon:yes gene_type:complete
MSNKGRGGVMKIFAQAGTIYIKIEGECVPSEWIYAMEYAMEKAKIQILTGDMKDTIQKFAIKVGGGPIG